MPYSVGKFAFFAITAMLVSPLARADTSTGPIVGGHVMHATKAIVPNVMNSDDHITLLKVIAATGMMDTLDGAGPLTMFAPTDAAFAALPAGTVDMLLKPENKDRLTAILKYHVVAGDYDTAKLKQMIKDGGGKASLTTLQGGTLTVMESGNGISVRDDKGDVAIVSIADVKQSNGELDVIDRVMMP